MTDVWSPLAGEDPVPGDPWRLGDLANHFDARADTIRDVIRGLERLSTGEGEMHSVAVDELVAQRDDLLPHLRLLETRWERTAGALRRYCPVLERAQEMAATARRQSWDAQRAIDLRNRGGFFSFVGDIAGGVAGVYGSAWDGLGWVTDNFPSLNQISNALSIVGAVCAVVGLFCPPVGLLGVAIGAAKLAVDIGLMAQGQGSWWDVGTGALALATFGVGRIATTTARAAAAQDAIDASRTLRGTIGQAGALAGRVGTSEAGVRLTGAAMRGNQLRRFGEIATAFPAEHSMSAATRWGHALTRVQLDLPARHMLDLCPSAVSAARWAGGAIAATALLDTETVIDGISTATGGAIPNLETVIKEGARMP